MTEVLVLLGQVTICAAFVLTSVFFILGSLWLIVQFHHRLKDYRAK